MKLRKLHRTVGLVFSPFFLLTAVTGMILLWRKADLYSKESKSLMLGLHNWELGAKYIGVVLASALIFMTVTGLVLAIGPMLKKK
jgi:uncharacterized iron-regulated membrane protein